MMALEPLDTKWAGVIQPDPDSAESGEVETEYILAPADGPRRTLTFRLRVYTAIEFARLLEDVGFAEIECFGDLDWGSSREESARCASQKADHVTAPRRLPPPPPDGRAVLSGRRMLGNPT